MSLWIRSQDKSALVKTDNVLYNIEEMEICCVLTTTAAKISLGRYNTEERIMEIMDDIQAKMKNKYLAKVNPILKQSEFQKAVKDMEKFNNIDLIGSNGLVDIQPINPEVIIYEMPEK